MNTNDRRMKSRKSLFAASAPRSRRTVANLPVPPVREVPDDEAFAATTVCFRCRDVVKPVEDRYPTWKTHTVAVFCFLIGIPFLVFLPYCFDCFGTDVLRCPKCGCYINVASPDEDDNDYVDNS